MNLSKKEFNRMEYLLGKAKVEGLYPSEEFELRKYVEREQPSAQKLTMEDIIALGVILVGIYLLIKALE